VTESNRCFCTETADGYVTVRRDWPTTDAYPRDTLLSAVDPGKCVALGTVWTGNLKPEIDGTSTRSRS
jgi:hypothetical protein